MTELTSNSRILLRGRHQHQISILREDITLGISLHVVASRTVASITSNTVPKSAAFLQFSSCAKPPDSMAKCQYCYTSPRNERFANS